LFFVEGLDVSGIPFAFGYFVMKDFWKVERDDVSGMARVLCLFIFLFIFVCSSAHAASREQEAKMAWRAIVPAIEVFWQEYQTSPEKLKEDAWPLISMLKNFIKAYPDSKMVPEAYYILGEAYASVSFWPEAEAHWKIVTRYFPNSRWTNQALNSLILYYEKSGNQNKLQRFYREIMRRFPDSIAARTAEVLMARQALERGNVKRAREVAKMVSSSSPMAEVDVPELLDLKARLALHDKKPGKAIGLWVRYLNLTRNPGFRSTTLFHIAETYRRMGDVLKARKYYALIRRDFKGQPEYLFARFRMLQLKEEARERLSRYTRGRVSAPDYYESEQVYKEILKRYPTHPLTREVKCEYVATELRKKDYLKALLLAERYLREDPQSPYSKEILLMADQAKNGLIGGEYKVSELKKIVESLKPMVGKKSGAYLEIYQFMKDALERKWVELQGKLLQGGKPLEALKEYWTFLIYFNGNSAWVKQARRQAVTALVKADEGFLTKGRPLQLINFYFSNRRKIDALKVARHYLLLAKAEERVGLGLASLLSYQRAWDTTSDGSLRCTILMDWTGQIIKERRLRSAQDTITLLNLYCPEESMGARGLLYKSVLALWQKDYRAALNMAMDSINIKPARENVNQAILGAIYLAEWDTAWQIYKSHKALIPREEKIALTRRWGDEALSLGEPQEALKAYRLLNGLDGKDPANHFRLNLASSVGKDPRKAKILWAEAAKGEKGFWAKASKAEASYYKFWEKAGSQL